MQNTSSDHKQHKMIFGLDMMRALAIILVLIGHSSQHSSAPEWFQKLGALGSLGVELFFVLSGFLIGGILLNLIEKNKFKTFSDLTTFWKRRWLRTVPLYIIALLAFLRFDYHGWHPLSFHPEYWLFLQNFAWSITDDFFTLSWSLAVEEHFYLWFPLLFLVLFSFLHKNVSFYSAAFILIASAIIYRASLLTMDWNEFNFNVRMVVLSRLDAIMFGVIMVYIQRYHIALWSNLYKLSPVFMLLVGLLFFLHYSGNTGTHLPFIQIFGMTIQSFLLSLLLPWFAERNYEPKNYFSDFITLTSRISYSLYLGHIMVIIFINYMLNITGVYTHIYPQPYLLYPIYFICFYLLAIFSYYTVERPFLDIRDGKLTLKHIIHFIPFGLLVCLLVFFV